MPARSKYGSGSSPAFHLVVALGIIHAVWTAQLFQGLLHVFKVGHGGREIADVAGNQDQLRLGRGDTLHHLVHFAVPCARSHMKV